MSIIYIYLFLALILGFFMSVTSKEFKELSFWKQFLVLSISPLLFIRELFTKPEGEK